MPTAHPSKSLVPWGRMWQTLPVHGTDTGADGRYPVTVPVDTTAWVTALLFGFLLGWGLARSPADHGVGLRSTVLLTAIGVVTWLGDPVHGSDRALAAVGMTFAGITATLVVAAASRRQPM